MHQGRPSGLPLQQDKPPGPDLRLVELHLAENEAEAAIVHRSGIGCRVGSVPFSCEYGRL